ncbi:hypothetical protein Tcan_00725, partial [Toxocara canis]
MNSKTNRRALCLFYSNLRKFPTGASRTLTAQCEWLQLGGLLITNLDSLPHRWLLNKFRMPLIRPFFYVQIIEHLQKFLRRADFTDTYAPLNDCINERQIRSHFVETGSAITLTLLLCGELKEEDCNDKVKRARWKFLKFVCNIKSCLFQGEAY